MQLVNNQLMFPKIQEGRHGQCLTQEFDIKSLPTVVVIIPYLHESLELMKQTVASLIANTPKELLDQILFVDDGNPESTRYTAELVALHPKVKVHRNEQRQGLIKAKVTGAALTKSPVIVFMEPHCRANRQWLEPLLTQLKASRTTIAVPVIDIIPEDNTKLYQYAGSMYGGFDWNLEFNWMGTANERNRSYTEPDPFAMPALSGGIFAINRDWWEESGTYDDRMKEWGSEHIEMSLRTWRCGGAIKAIPCSRIGHLFRKARPYTFHGEAAELNKKRLMAVWLDNHKADVYKHDPGLEEVDSGPIEDRLKLKKRLHCKSMDWYLNHIYPELKSKE